jgi:hypothetical protein
VVSTRIFLPARFSLCHLPHRYRARTHTHTQLAHDVDVRPDAPSLDDYDDVPVEAFGAAMLRGMGWTDGGEVGLTNKAVNKPVAPVQRDGRQVWGWWARGEKIIVSFLMSLSCSVLNAAVIFVNI